MRVPRSESKRLVDVDIAASCVQSTFTPVTLQGCKCPTRRLSTATQNHQRGVTRTSIQRHCAVTRSLTATSQRPSYVLSPVPGSSTSRFPSPHNSVACSLYLRARGMPCRTSVFTGSVYPSLKPRWPRAGHDAAVREPDDGGLAGRPWASQPAIPALKGSCL